MMLPRTVHIVIAAFTLASSGSSFTHAQAQSAPSSTVAVRDSGRRVVWSDEFNRDGLPDATK